MNSNVLTLIILPNTKYFLLERSIYIGINIENGIKIRMAT